MIHSPKRSLTNLLHSFVYISGRRAAGPFPLEQQRPRFDGAFVVFVDILGMDHAQFLSNPGEDLQTLVQVFAGVSG